MSPEPNSGCQAVQAALIQRAEGGEPGAGLDAHLVACAACQRELERAQRRVALVRSLTRVSVPQALDGLAVAALQAGARQERALRALIALPARPAPDQLAHRVHGPRAPAVLDRLVGEDLADPRKAVARRYAGRLERLRAPADLDARLQRRPRGAARPALLARLVPGLLAAAGVLLVVGVLVFTQARRDVTAGRPGPILVVEHVASIHSLDPAASGLLSGLTGGLLDADRLSRQEGS